MLETRNAHYFALYPPYLDQFLIPLRIPRAAAIQTYSKYNEHNHFVVPTLHSPVLNPHPSTKRIARTHDEGPGPPSNNN